MNLIRKMALLVCVFIIWPGWGNNISVTGVARLSQVPGSHWMVRFNIQWENSWRNDIAGTGQAEPYNWDAAWVFVKYRTNVTENAWGDWRHASLSTNASDHVAPAISVGLSATTNAAGQTVTNGVGVFIYRNANGSGTFTANSVRLRWNYAADGVADDANIDLKVCAIEMVYVPTGAFYVGSGGTENNYFHDSTNASTPFLITNENYEIIIASNGIPGQLYFKFTGGDHGGTISNVFPKGFNAFYGMKYEITQYQYVDFLNTLTRSQQLVRFTSATVSNFMGDSGQTSPSNHNGIQLISTNGAPTNACVFANNLNTNNAPNSSDDGQWIACNYLMVADLAAYLDWAGLRPMTELEFEKACRGTNFPVANVLAWGGASATLIQATNVVNSGTANESPLPVTANCVDNNNGTANIQGPLRAGCLGIGGGTREKTGAGYYGMMELSGNVSERAVTVGSTAGRRFTGLHGDGRLDTNGYANVAGWPGTPSVGIWAGAGPRGGSWYNSYNPARISDRINAADEPQIRTSYYGGRGGRTAP